MSYLGNTFAAVFQGLMASPATALGGLCLLVGLCICPAAAFLLFAMFVICMYRFGHKVSKLDFVDLSGILTVMAC